MDQFCVTNGSNRYMELVLRIANRTGSAVRGPSDDVSRFNLNISVCCGCSVRVVFFCAMKNDGEPGRNLRTITKKLFRIREPHLNTSDTIIDTPRWYLPRRLQVLFSLTNSSPCDEQGRDRFGELAGELSFSGARALPLGLDFSHAMWPRFIWLVLHGRKIESDSTESSKQPTAITCLGDRQVPAWRSSHRSFVVCLIVTDRQHQLN